MSGRPLTRLQAADHLLDSLNALQRVWEARWREICEEESTHPSQAHALLFLLQRGPEPMRELGRGLSIAPSTATRLVEQMEKQGWVTRAPDPGDRRRVLLHLLEEGEERAWGLQERARQAVWRRLGPLQDAQGALAGLRALVDAFDGAD